MPAPVARPGSDKCTVIGTSTVSDFPSPSGASPGQMDKCSVSVAIQDAVQKVNAANRVNAARVRLWLDRLCIKVYWINLTRLRTSA